MSKQNIIIFEHTKIKKLFQDLKENLEKFFPSCHSIRNWDIKGEIMKTMFHVVSLHHSRLHAVAYPAQSIDRAEDPTTESDEEQTETGFFEDDGLIGLTRDQLSEIPPSSALKYTWVGPRIGWKKFDFFYVPLIKATLFQIG